MGQWMKDHPEEAKKARLKYYYGHKESEIKRIKRRVKDNTEWLRGLKQDLKCIKCGENSYPCLDFHHRDPNTKDEVIARVIRRGWSRERILAEIEKCDVLCANCHRKEHYCE